MTVSAQKKEKKGIFQQLAGEKRKTDISISFFAYVMILLVVGLVMMASASYAWAYTEHNGDGLYYAKSQLKNAVIGFIIMIVMMNIDYHNLKSFQLNSKTNLNVAGILYWGVAVLLLVVIFIGNDEGGSMGARRWITIGGINFQPSEIAKLSMIVFFASCMEKDGQKMNKLMTGIVKYGLLFIVYALLIFLEKHISGIMLLGVIALTLIFCGGSNKKQFVPLFLGGIVIAYLFIKWQAGVEGSYVQVRVKSWKDPFADVLNDTWQTANSLIAIGSGGLFGLGLGNSRQKYLYLPETKNDFVFPIVCEELGFIGALAIMIIYFLLIAEGYTIAVRCKDRFGMLLAVGITTQIGIQTVFNLAVVSNIIPNTGISLPFFSYGGTALIMQLAEMGIMLNISQQRKQTYSLKNK